MNPCFPDGWTDEKPLSGANTRARSVKEVKIGRNIGVDLVHHSEGVTHHLIPNPSLVLNAPLVDQVVRARIIIPACVCIKRRGRTVSFVHDTLDIVVSCQIGVEDTVPLVSVGEWDRIGGARKICPGYSVCPRVWGGIYEKKGISWVENEIRAPTREILARDIVPIANYIDGSSEIDIRKNRIEMFGLKTPGKQVHSVSWDEACGV